MAGRAGPGRAWSPARIGLAEDAEEPGPQAVPGEQHQCHAHDQDAGQGPVLRRGRGLHGSDENPAEEGGST
jgi:hypothetical protein